MASCLNSDSDIRILLIGRTGHGKSSTGNTIAGREIFEVSGASTSETKTCTWSKKLTRFGRIVEVVDTPGIFDTDQPNYAIHKELLRSLALTTPGFHVIAFVLKRGEKFTEEIQNTLELFFNWFGQGVENFACIILTDTNDEDTMNMYLNYKPQEKLTDLVHKCNGRVVPLNNHASLDVTNGQVERIFQMAEKIRSTNNNRHFSNVVFKLAEEYAKNKYPRELTPDSIHILETAGLHLQFTKNKKQCSYSDYVFNISAKKENNESAKKLKDHSSDTEKAEHHLPKPCGNLVIWDNNTNTRIDNSTEKNATSTSPCLNTQSDEVQGRRANESDVYRTENEIDYSAADVTSPSIESNRPRTERIQERIRRTQSNQSDRPPRIQSSMESSERSRKMQENEIDYWAADVTSPSIESNRPRKERIQERIRRTQNNQSDRSPRIQSSMESSERSRKMQEDRSDCPSSGRNPNRSRENRFDDLSPEVNTHQRSAEQHNPGQILQSQSSRANRVVDLKSVQYDSITEFKDSINNEDGDTLINGLLNYVKKAWWYCKEKIKCILQ